MQVNDSIHSDREFNSKQYLYLFKYQHVELTSYVFKYGHYNFSLHNPIDLIQ